jgi:2-polyprenyl-6-methoxyphenol hydroxylase-like FAD-dependent oxidoreductase
VKALSAAPVVVIGGGIAGLATALALLEQQPHGGREVVIVERDPEPPEIAPEQAFEAWKRPGVPQFRHAHIFLARGHTWLRDRHPQVLAKLRDAGILPSELQDALPDAHLASYTKQPGDEDLLHLWGRRATFEYVLRRHVGGLSHVRFVHGAQVDGLLTETDGQRVQVRGIRLRRGDAPAEELRAELVIDASGKRSKAPEWLAAEGVRVEVEHHPSDFVYACRHYRLKHPESPPSRRDGGGNLDYLGYATFHAEHGHYALTFGCPVYEEELVERIGRVEGFDALCKQFPVLETWTEQSVPTTKVLGAGAFENRWSRYGAPGGRELLGFFAVGDSHVETNPMYGRGVSAAFLQAQALADVLQETANPAARAQAFEQRTRALLRPAFELSVQTDRIYHVRAQLRRGARVPFGARVVNYLYEHSFLPANATSVLVAREFIKAQQMRELSPLRLRLAMSLQLLLALLRSVLLRGATPYLPKVPPRSELLQRLTQSS